VASRTLAAPSTAPDNRDDWPTWIDADGDCQDTRAEVLIAEADGPVTLSPDGCRVVAGTWFDPYTATTFIDPAQLEIDHLVPLANVNASGGYAWDPTVKKAYANDLSSDATLIAVAASANRAKGERSPDQWKPPNRGYWCQYAED
jgi:hypothetical protein